METLNIVATLTDAGVIDVGAPMKEKALCYEILDAAEMVIAATSNAHFKLGMRTLTIVMQKTGVVDVAAPLPPRVLCVKMLEVARFIIERYNEEQAPVMRPFSADLMGVPQ